MTGCSVAHQSRQELDRFIHEQMQLNHIPGLAVTIVKSGALAWSKGYGWADIEQRKPMTPDTVQNIGSISKPFVTTAIMQCVERGELNLEDDVNEYLGFAVRNPNHPNTAITFSQLLTHHSSIADGSAYGRGYQCGDTAVSLDDWISGYFIPGGAYYSAEENFHAWAPDEHYEYNNVAFGLLAYLVEEITQRSFENYCQTNIFRPLNMQHTSWFVSGIDEDQHAIPYAYVSDGRLHSPTWGGIDLGLVSGETPPSDFVGPVRDCIYEHPNYADGFLRTSVSQLANFQIAYLSGGALNGERILSKQSIDQIFTVREVKTDAIADTDDAHGLTWHRRRIPNGPLVWGHGGGDPGISTLFDFRPSSADGVIIFANTWGASLDQIGRRLFEEADRMS